MTKHAPSILILLLCCSLASGQLWTYAYPEATVLPSVSGNATIGSELTFTPGTYANGVRSRTITWLRNGVAIESETGLTYTTTGTEGDVITATETVTNSGGTVVFVATGGVVLDDGEAPDLPIYPPEYANWLSEVLQTQAVHGDYWMADTWSPAETAFNGRGQYEPWYGFWKLADHLGGTQTELNTQASYIADLWIEGVTDVYPTYAQSGIWTYTRGFGDDWVRNADADSKAAAIGLSENAAYASDATSLAGGIKGEGVSREVAYTLMAYMACETHLDEDHRDRAEVLVDVILADVGDEIANIYSPYYVAMANGGHIEQWLGDYVTDANGDYVSGETRFLEPLDSPGFAPWMGGLTAYSLIYHYEHSTQLGTHQGANDSATLSLADGGWVEDFLVGRTVNNLTDGSTGTITANIQDTVTVTLSGGSGNDWDTGDEYEIVGVLVANAQAGTHSGSANASVLTTSSSSNRISQSCVGRVLTNTTDGSSGTITAVTGNTVTATLSGGTDNDWDVSDAYSIAGGPVVADSRILPKLIRLGDATWNECWEVVPDSLSFVQRFSQGLEAPALNQEISPYFAWLGMKTGDQRWFDRVDLCFEGALTSESLTYRGANIVTVVTYPKEFNEHIRWAFDCLDWYNAGKKTHE